MEQSLAEALKSAGLLSVAFQVVTTIAVGVCTFFIRRLMREFDEVKDEQKKMREKCPAVHSKADLELAQFKIHVATEYAKTATVSRLHERLDTIINLLLENKGGGK